MYIFSVKQTKKKTTGPLVLIKIHLIHKPSLPTDKYGDFIDANRIEDAEDRLKTMKKLVCVKLQQNIAKRTCLSNISLLHFEILNKFTSASFFLCPDPRPPRSLLPHPQVLGGPPQEGGRSL